MRPTVPLAPAPGAAPGARDRRVRQLGAARRGRAVERSPERRLARRGRPAFLPHRSRRFVRRRRARPRTTPRGSALASWTLRGVETSAGATVVLKDCRGHLGKRPTLRGPSREDQTGGAAALRDLAGHWDVAVVVPGFAPAFVAELDVYAEDETLNVAAVQLARAGRVTGSRARCAHGETAGSVEGVCLGRRRGSGRTWRRSSSTAGRFHRDGATLDFASLPVGGWELKVGGAAPERAARRRQRPEGSGALVELGDLYVTDLGKLRVVAGIPGPRAGRQLRGQAHALHGSSSKASPRRSARHDRGSRRRGAGIRRDRARRRR